MLLCLTIVLLCSILQTDSKSCNIEDYGAKGDGKTDNTKAIQAAINDCKTDSTVIIPSGLFLTYPISVVSASNFSLNVGSGATLRALPREGWPVVNGAYVNFLSITSCKGCTILGGGLLDGDGTPWYIDFDNGKIAYNRPMFVSITNSMDILVSKINILNSPMFNLVLSSVTRAEIAHVNITCQWYDGGTKEPHNTDGIDPGSNSKQIHIHDCYIYNGDDSVAVKPGSIDGGCTSDVLVENCEFHRGHGCSIGSVGSGCVQNVIFRNISMSNQLGGCIVKTFNDGRPGFVRNITWENISIDQTDNCIYVNTNYHNSTFPSTLKISELQYENVIGTNCEYPFRFICQKDSPCMDIHLDNVDVSKDEKHSPSCEYAHGTAVKTDPASCLEP